jgi:hypothetical protein
MNAQSKNSLGALALGLAAVGILAAIARNQKVNPNVRVLAQDAEGTIVQDLVTGAIHFLV